MGGRLWCRRWWSRPENSGNARLGDSTKPQAGSVKFEMYENLDLGREVGKA